MKRLDELGISPTPWDCDIENGDTVSDAIGYNVCCTDGDSKLQVRANATLIKSAPKLYKAVYELLEIVCDNCKCNIIPIGEKQCIGCPRVQRARAVLAEAAGESEVSK